MREFELIIHYDRIGGSDMYNCYEVGEIVRCKDCKRYKPLDENRPYECPVGLLDCMPDDFCSRGERMDEVSDATAETYEATFGDGSPITYTED